MKNLLLTKVFLLVALFLGGCSTTETNTTPSDALIDLINETSGVFYVSISSDNIEKAYGFKITDNATYYREYYSDGIIATSLKYTTGSDTSATYEGYTSGGASYKVILTDLTSSGGIFTAYFNGNKSIEIDFEWYTYTPNNTLIDLIGGKWGQFYADNSEGVSTLYGFGISDDATYYFENSGFQITYTTGTDNTATYGSSYRIRLTKLTSTGGTYTRYTSGSKDFEVDFTWYTDSTSSVSSISSISAVSFESDEPYSSAIQALSQQ